MKTTPETIAKALRILADEITAPDDVPACCLRDAATMIEDMHGAIQRVLALPLDHTTDLGDAQGILREPMSP